METHRGGFTLKSGNPPIIRLESLIFGNPERDSSVTSGGFPHFRGGNPLFHLDNIDSPYDIYFIEI